MEVRSINKQNQDAFNKVVTHPLQSYEWGEFREKTGVKVIRRGFFENNKLVKGFQLTIHKIPYTSWTIGYLPKGYLPDKELLEELHTIGKQEHCIFIQLEPHVTMQHAKLSSKERFTLGQKMQNSYHPLFTKYTFQLDLTKAEDELLKNMHPKTRYNIRVAQKHSVRIVEDNSDEAFATYWRLTEETTKRQKFFAHTKKYHDLMWQTLKNQKSKIKNANENSLQAHLFLAKYTPSSDHQPIALVAWILFTFHSTLYYPYGSSSNHYRNVMASNLMMWEAIRFGKKLGCKTFDMWGSLGENPDTNDPWYGFHRLKQGYGPTLVEFIGSYDLIINPLLYQAYKTADTLRWMILKKN